MMLRTTKAVFGLAPSRLLLLALLLLPSPAIAGFVIGPGPVSVTNGDGLSYPLITVDLNAPATLGPGNYVVSQFNYRFSLYDGFVTIGDITPIVLIGDGVSDFTPVAIGDTITYNGPTAFISTAFGGSDTFSLTATTTIYAGLYWNAPPYNGGPEYRMPIGSNNDGGLIFNRQSGADFPVIGSPISGGNPLPTGFNHRRYDFSIEVDPAVAPVPEPTSLLLTLTGGVGLFGWGKLRRKWSAKAVCGLVLSFLLWSSDARADFIPGDMYVSARSGSISVGQVAPNGAVTSLASGVDLTCLAFSPSGNLYVANPETGGGAGGQVYEVSPTGVLSLFVTLPSNNNAGISHMAFDSSGNMYVTNWYDNGVDKVTPAGVVSSYATGIAHPTGLAFDNSGNLYVSSEFGNGYVSKVTPGGVISVFATGFHYAEGLAFDNAGNLYVANSTYSSNPDSTVDKITPNGVVSTFATGFIHPQGLAFDSSGNLYVAEYFSGTISMVGPGGGTAVLFATGFAGTESIAFYPPTFASPVPEPASAVLLLAGLPALGLAARAGRGRSRQLIHAGQPLAGRR